VLYKKRQSCYILFPRKKLSQNCMRDDFTAEYPLI
jgi:hypothetical protein